MISSLLSGCMVDACESLVMCFCYVLLSLDMCGFSFAFPFPRYPWFSGLISLFSGLALMFPLAWVELLVP